MLDAHLWQRLEDHGVTQEHLALLLQLLEIQRNGSWSWHYVHGNLTQCDARLVFPSRPAEVARVGDCLGAMLDGASVLR